MIYHKPEDSIIVYPGKIKKIKDLKNGDYLFGPDSKPRKIINIKDYYGNINNIISNKDHKLYIKNNNKIFLKRTNKNKFDINNIVTTDISCQDWLNSSKTFRHIYKLFSVSEINFPNQKISIDPYFLGVLLGDGSIIHNIGVTTEDHEIIEEIFNQARLYSLHIRKVNQKNKDIITYFLSGSGKKNSNQLINDIRNLNLYGKTCHDKFIPSNYLFNSRTVRLGLLAGLLDTDGSKNNNCYDFITKSDYLASDICILARSLGFSASAVKCVKTCQNNFSGIYNRIYISGDTNNIPVRIERKKSSQRMQKKDIHMTGFNLYPILEKNYYRGIKVNKDNKYIDNNFVILNGI